MDTLDYYSSMLKLNFLILFIKYVLLFVFFSKKRNSVYYENHATYILCLFVEVVCSLIPLFNIGYLILSGARLIYIIANFNKKSR